MNDDRPVLLKISQLQKYFKLRQSRLFSRKRNIVHAVDSVNLRVYAGETLGLVGESGCGKTTLARLILRLIEPTAGHIYFDGQEITELQGRGLKRLHRNMQLIFQDPFDSLNPRMKVRRIIEEPLKLHNMGDGKKRQEQVHALLETVGLDRRVLNQYPSSLSGGQRQRVGIARALALTPKLVLCDEPVSALDVSIRAQIINLLEDLQDSFDLTYIFISHDLSVVKHISDRVAVMYLGRIVELASNEAIFQRPHHPYTEALLSAIPIADPRVEKQRRRIVLPGDPPSPVHRPAGCHFHPRCPIAQEICRINEPPLTEVAPGHFVACHFAAPFPIASMNSRNAGVDQRLNSSHTVNSQPAAALANTETQKENAHWHH